ncbi:MAG: quinoprotein dehydrogenase-associated SoxYZ-like carrier [Donghicola eburneus]|nr:quinoprotein dehydrogenase-associated SoxYZ-like carrier [Donghicola eburneus]MCI5039398.1 quinoprotein dehydrogenase-associated SoxYZ-like carrier [Donghicola eburneus]
MITRCLAAALALSIALPANAQDNPMRDSPTWTDLQADVIGEMTPLAADGMFRVETPARAQDAGTVPIRIVQTDPAMAVTAATVVVDENPAPVAGTFTFGQDMLPLDFELRVRVNQYSNVRVLAKTPNGLAMDGGYVKASGGCSAPATRDPEMAKVDMGQMKLRQFEPLDHNRREAQIMVRHPNYSGLQRDQLTQLFIPAHFLSEIEVSQGDTPLFSMEGGISISENPVFRFIYTDNGEDALVVTATDTEGNIWRNVLPKSGS